MPRTPKTTPPTKPATDLVVIGTVGPNQITAPRMDARTAAIQEAIKQYEGYKGTIDSEDVKVFVNSELRNVVGQRNALRRELKSITDPLDDAARQIRSAKTNAQNLFAPALAGLEAAERILKDEIVRYESLVERRRLEAEATERRKAEEEQRRREDEARAKAEDAARKHEEDQRRADALARKGKDEEAARLREQSDQHLAEVAEEVEADLEEAQHVGESVFVPSTSVKMAGTAVTGKWVAELVDVSEVLAGIVAHTTPLEAVRIKVNGRLQPMSEAYVGRQVDGIEIGMAWFNDRARKEQDNFNYRGVTAKFVKDVRVTA